MDRWLACRAAGVLLAVAALAAVAPRAVADNTAGGCARRIVDVSLSPGAAADYQVATWLCSPSNPSSDAVQILVSGTTYDHTYWDFDHQPDRYSYVRALTGAGVPVLNYDRIGVGASSRPLSSGVTLDAHAWVLHQLVSALRAGVFGSRYRKVVTVGHSQGSAIALREASTQHDVDGLVVTGLVHTPEGPTGVAGLLGAMYPAQADPAFPDATPGYLTTRPGTRGAIFYHLADADPRVIEIDEATKQMTTPAELATAPSAFAGQPDASIPVLDVIGQYDALFCPITGCTATANPLDLDPTFYADPAQVQTYMLADSGHDINLHRNATDWFDTSIHWQLQHFPRTAPAHTVPVPEGAKE